MLIGLNLISLRATIFAVFKNNPIYDFANSNETKVSYNNYKFSLPNEDVRFKVSGNYAVQIYRDEKPSEILATICFTVVDPLVDIKGQVTPVMIDTDWSHQRVNFDVDLKDLAVINPETELKVNVLQNNRRDNLISNPHPSVVTRSVVSYNNSSNIVFAGGNEYRRMAFYKGKNGNFHVKEMMPKKNGYEVILLDDRAKNNFAYQYQADLNGRYFIKCGQCDDSETEAQYCLVKFSLFGDEYTDGKVYVLGDIFNNQLSDASEMIYNPATNQYELNSILKEGRYDYKYVYVPNDSALGEYISIDGDYSQTENEYTVYIYYRPTGGKYDKLIGITTIKNNPIGK